MLCASNSFFGFLIHSSFWGFNISKCLIGRRENKKNVVRTKNCCGWLSSPLCWRFSLSLYEVLTLLEPEKKILFRLYRLKGSWRDSRQNFKCLSDTSTLYPFILYISKDQKVCFSAAAEIRKSFVKEKPR